MAPTVVIVYNGSAIIMGRISDWEMLLNEVANEFGVARAEVVRLPVRCVRSYRDRDQKTIPNPVEDPSTHLENSQVHGTVFYLGSCYTTIFRETKKTRCSQHSHFYTDSYIQE